MSFLKNVKGTQDYLPSEQLIRNHIKDTLEKTFKIYGFKPLETPIINYNELLAYKYGGGEEIIKEIYRLSDQGNRKLALRYDLTIPFSKVIGMNPKIRLPFKRYEIGKVFRDGPIKKGRMREFVQCDIDIVGVKNVSAEAELMEIAKYVFEQLNLEINIQYNNRKLLVGILTSLGICENDFNSIILSLDKLEKIGVDGVLEELSVKAINSTHIFKLKELLYDKKINTLTYIKEKFSHPLINSGLDELEELQSYLSFLNIESIATFNPFLARGLNIYTGTIYEIFMKNGSISSSIGSGGRYDEIIGKFLNVKQSYPTVGLSFGLDVIFSAISDNTQNLLPKNFIDLYIIPIDTMKESLSLATLIRKNYGIKVEVDLSKRKLKKAMSYADKENIPYIIILGEEELNNQILEIKNMHTGEGFTSTIDDLKIGNFSFENLNLNERVLLIND